MIKSTLTTLAIAGIAAYGLSSVPAAAGDLAQAQGQPQMQQQAPATDFSEETIESFAEASLELQKVGQEYQPKLAEAGSPEEQQAVRDEARQKMVEAIQESGLSINEYNQVQLAARNDPSVAERVSKHIQQMQ